MELINLIEEVENIRNDYDVNIEPYLRRRDANLIRHVEKMIENIYHIKGELNKFKFGKDYLVSANSLYNHFHETGIPYIEMSASKFKKAQMQLMEELHSYSSKDSFGALQTGHSSGGNSPS